MNTNLENCPIGTLNIAKNMVNVNGEHATGYIGYPAEEIAEIAQKKAYADQFCEALAQKAKTKEERRQAQEVKKVAQECNETGDFSRFTGLIKRASHFVWSVLSNMASTELLKFITTGQL